MTTINDLEDLNANQNHRLKLFQVFGVWMRFPDIPQVADKPKELREVLYACTHEPIPNQTNEQLEKLIKEFEVNMSIEFEGLYDETKEHPTCICSCSSCSTLYHIIHLKTLKQFAVGTTCIKKIIDEDFDKK